MAQETQASHFFFRLYKLHFCLIVCLSNGPIHSYVLGFASVKYLNDIDRLL
ncbi:unnamed protein product [Brassica rapa subsp. trilocularis]